MKLEAKKGKYKRLEDVPAGTFIEWDIDDIQEPDYNPRTISKKAREGLTASVEEFGMIHNIAVNKTTHNIVSGNRRYEIAKARGDKTVIIYVGEWDTTAEKKAVITLNNPHIQGRFTNDVKSLIAEIRMNIPDTQFDDLQFDKIDLTSLDLGGDIQTSAGSEQEYYPEETNIPQSRIVIIYESAAEKRRLEAVFGKEIDRSVYFVTELLGDPE